MRRTLLAVGFAVLMSMLLAPHGGKYGVEGWDPFFFSTRVSGDIERDLVRGRWAGHDRHAGTGDHLSRCIVCHRGEHSLATEKGRGLKLHITSYRQIVADAAARLAGARNYSGLSGGGGVGGAGVTS